MILIFLSILFASCLASNQGRRKLFSTSSCSFSTLFPLPLFSCKGLLFDMLSSHVTNVITVYKLVIGYTLYFFALLICNTDRQ